jgi:hypothetical protein
MPFIQHFLDELRVSYMPGRRSREKADHVDNVKVVLDRRLRRLAQIVPQRSQKSFEEREGEEWID